jgi:hypothetical protein
MTKRDHPAAVFLGRKGEQRSERIQSAVQHAGIESVADCDGSDHVSRPVNERPEEAAEAIAPEGSAGTHGPRG